MLHHERLLRAVASSLPGERDDLLQVGRIALIGVPESTPPALIRLKARGAMIDSLRKDRKERDREKCAVRIDSHPRWQENQTTCQLPAPEKTTDPLFDRAIEALPGRQAKVIVMRYREDRDQREVAEALAISRHQARRIETEAIGRLRRVLRAG